MQKLNQELEDKILKLHSHIEEIRKEDQILIEKSNC